MPLDTAFQGTLFTRDFLMESIAGVEEWASLSDDELAAFRADLQILFETFPTDGRPNETQTEDDLIWPILTRLGWSEVLRQQNLSASGRTDVPDGLLFADADRKASANREAQEWRRYAFGLAIVESKRWGRPLDRASTRRDEGLAPSTQMLRYMRRADDLTRGGLRWGILTNGARWRLYYQGARSVAEQFFEVDLAVLLGIGARPDDLFAMTLQEARHALRVFVLMFRREAFALRDAGGRTFHQLALEEGKFYEERVAKDLSGLVFDRVYPLIVRSIARAAPDAPLGEVRDASLILLYRLLFVLYAEDRGLLPVNDARYDDYALRPLRSAIGGRKDDDDVFSTTQARYWQAFDGLCRAIDEGDASIGLPPYNGGLFDERRTALLTRVRLPDAMMAEVIDALSFERTGQGRRYINYRDLSVQQLGSIYERLLEHEVVREGDVVDIRPNIFARKGSGSYYTPAELVALVLDETLEPLIERRTTAFRTAAEAAAQADPDDVTASARLRALDPAERLLELRVCDPAMGSGHFLVSLVDILADQVIVAMAEAETVFEDFEHASERDYASPLAGRIQEVRETILQNAAARDWTVDVEQLDDRHIVRRMVLKRCVYGVDKNPMAVELAKVSLWLHSFTVGAPLSFLDHHLRCGDSLFGAWVHDGVAAAARYGGPLLLHGPVRTAIGAAASMQRIERLPDAEIAEAHDSARIYEGVREMVAPLEAFLSLIHALAWVTAPGRADKAALQGFFDGSFGDPLAIARGIAEPAGRGEAAQRFAELLRQARPLIEEERFLPWQVAFPGVWKDWEAEGLVGGFDAVIGNPPWDRMKMQEVEWFAARRREVAMHPRASDRKRAIEALRMGGDPLARDYEKARERAEAAVEVARRSGSYPLLSGGDVNIYSLFVERAFALAKPDGMVGLLVPSGIASDKTAAPFFAGVATEGRLKAFYDFENRKVFFPDVHASFKFCAFIGSPAPTHAPAQLVFYAHSVAELADPDRRIPLAADDFERLNPNTGTAPIFRRRRDAELTTAIYRRLPVLVRRVSQGTDAAWPVRYQRMFDMTNASGLFRTRSELEDTEGAWPIGGNRFESAAGEWLPLYVGRMIHQFDHRAASVVVSDQNVHNAALSADVSEEQKADPDFVPTPQYWVSPEASGPIDMQRWAFGFRDIARATDARTMIASAVPCLTAGNTLPLLRPTDPEAYRRAAPLMLANLNALILDFVARQKAQSTHLNWYIVEQLPVVPLEAFETTTFGPKTAAEIVREAVLELTYTAHDMAPFARDMGYVDPATGEILPPFTWDEERRLRLRAKLDAVFFALYGITDRDDIRHVYGTFPIVERQEVVAHGVYRSRDLCLAFLNALLAGRPDASIAN